MYLPSGPDRVAYERQEDLPTTDRVAGLVAKASASGAEDPGFDGIRLRRDFFRVES